jgi:hypothetical protein
VSTCPRPHILPWLHIHLQRVKVRSIALIVAFYEQMCQVASTGMIAYADSRHPEGFVRQRALAQVSCIYDTLERVFALAREQAITTYRAADRLAEQRIASVRQAKTLATAP